MTKTGRLCDIALGARNITFPTMDLHVFIQLLFALNKINLRHLCTAIYIEERLQKVKKKYECFWQYETTIRISVTKFPIQQDLCWTINSVALVAIVLNRPSDCHLSTKIVPTFVDVGVLGSQHDGSPMAVIPNF
jgi:hypothetical protein